MVMKFISNSPIVHLTSNTYLQNTNPIVLSITAGLGFSLNRWNHGYTSKYAIFATAAESRLKFYQFFADPSISSSSFSSPNPQSVVPNLPVTVDPLLGMVTVKTRYGLPGTR